MESTDAERFAAQVVDDPDSGCCLWTGYTTNGYGYFYLTALPTRARRQVRAHRWIYEYLVGPIPQDLTIDHLCRNTLCQNPAHLEPVTRSVNSSRGHRYRAPAPRVTHCIRGHEFTPENTYAYPDGKRECRACRPIWKARRK